jgi:hypothetical protein
MRNQEVCRWGNVPFNGELFTVTNGIRVDDAGQVIPHTRWVEVYDQNGVPVFDNLELTFDEKEDLFYDVIDVVGAMDVDPAELYEKELAVLN